MAVMSFPFLVRTVRLAFEEINPRLEHVARTLGASPARVFTTITLPVDARGMMAGAVWAFARALGEYGSVIFISGNMPMKTEIASLLIVTKLEQFDYAGAAAIGLLMLVSSFVLLFLVNVGQWWSTRHMRRVA